MKRKIAAGLAAAVALTTVLSGCGASEKSLDTTSVFIRKDGTLKAAVYEPFDTNTYSKEDLEAYLSDAVCAYNQAATGEAAATEKEAKNPLAVVLSSVEYKDDNAVLKMEYASCEDYLAFNEGDESLIQLASGTVAGAKEAGIDLDQFTVTDGTDTVSASGMEDESYIVFVQGTDTICVDGSITYVSEGVNKASSDTAEVTSPDTLSVIVFK